MSKRKLITYWEFTIEITGPRYRTKAEKHRIHRILWKRREQIEEAARLAAKSRLPPNFRAKVY